jgi:hypothetical protein
MSHETVYTSRAGRVEVPLGYYVISDTEKCQTGDRYYHYASESWQPVTDSRQAIGYESAVCRPKSKFKNVVIIE